MIIVGHGARAGIDDVVQLAERLHAPIATTFKAKGIVPDDHPLACGVLGRSGTPVASWLMNESDLLLVFGASFANHTGIASYKPIVQVDSEPDALGRFHPVTVPGARRHRGDRAPARARARARARASNAVDQRARRRRPPRDLAGGEGAARHRRPRAGRRVGRAVRRALARTCPPTR